jgi:hypothetical protein
MSFPRKRKSYDLHRLIDSRFHWNDNFLEPTYSNKEKAKLSRSDYILVI